MCCRRNTFMYAHIYGCACSLPLKHRFCFLIVEKLTLFFDHKKESLLKLFAFIEFADFST